MEANRNCQLRLIAERMSYLGSNVKTSLSVNIDANEHEKNDITLSCGADKNNGDNFNVAVDTNILICRDFDEVNKILKEEVRNS